MCDKDFAELSGELSDAICLETLVLLGKALELFRKFFRAARAVFLALGFFFGPAKISESAVLCRFSSQKCRDMCRKMS